MLDKTFVINYNTASVVAVNKYCRLPLRTLKHRRIYYNQVVINDYLREIEDLGLAFNNLEFFKRIVETTPKMELTKTTFEAYEYILNNDDINKDSIKELYDILSREELENLERNDMGDYYRKSEEFIKSSSSCFFERVGSRPEEIDKYMSAFINFINGFELDDFIKSQIISLYLVYIHPYPNVNGRMSRFLSSWYFGQE